MGIPDTGKCLPCIVFCLLCAAAKKGNFFPAEQDLPGERRAALVPDAAYYPLEEAYMRNLALEPLHELYTKRNIKFSRVIWLKGFTCPNDILETIKISFANEAAMVCGMDWAEHNKFFIFSDRSVVLFLKEDN